LVNCRSCWESNEGRPFGIGHQPKPFNGGRSNNRVGYTQASPFIFLQSAIGLGCLTTCPENGLIEGETEGEAKGKE